jgi:hypothetical protein
MIAEAVARKVFAQRGNHSEAHLSEAELAGCLQAALDLRDRLTADIIRARTEL